MGALHELETVVLTPCNREARIVAIEQWGGEIFFHLEYLDEPADSGAGVRLRAELVRAFQAGRAKPEPVRIRARR